jgi:hypothetical protein
MYFNVAEDIIPLTDFKKQTKEVWAIWMKAACPLF